MEISATIVELHKNWYRHIGSTLKIDWNDLRDLSKRSFLSYHATRIFFNAVIFVTSDAPLEFCNRSISQHVAGIRFFLYPLVQDSCQQQFFSTVSDSNERSLGLLDKKLVKHCLVES